MKKLFIGAFWLVLFSASAQANLTSLLADYVSSGEAEEVSDQEVGEAVSQAEFLLSHDKIFSGIEDPTIDDVSEAIVRLRNQYRMPVETLAKVYKASNIASGGIGIPDLDTYVIMEAIPYIEEQGLCSDVEHDGNHMRFCAFVIDPDGTTFAEIQNPMTGVMETVPNVGLDV